MADSSVAVWSPSNKLSACFHIIRWGLRSDIFLLTVLCAEKRMCQITMWCEVWELLIWPDLILAFCLWSQCSLEGSERHIFLCKNQWYLSFFFFLMLWVSSCCWNTNYSVSKLIIMQVWRHLVFDIKAFIMSRFVIQSQRSSDVIHISLKLCCLQTWFICTSLLKPYWTLRAFEVMMNIGVNIWGVESILTSYKKQMYSICVSLCFDSSQKS